MSLKQNLHNLTNFLRPYDHIWNYEVLNFFPHQFPYKKDWIESLDLLDEKQLWAFDSRGELGPLKHNELTFLVREMKRLTKTVAKKQDNFIIPTKTAFKMGEKKNHEISRIMPHILSLNEKNQYDHIVDLGGGVGHLCRTAAHNHNLKAYCLDCDGNLLEKGLLREETVNHPNRVQFIHAEIGKPIKGYSSLKMAKDTPDWNDIISSNALVLGLHTCGSLSNEIYSLFLEKRPKSLVHFGCCYHKADPQKHFNLSKFNQENGFKISVHALTLASGPNLGVSFKDFEIKKRVKYYRNSLHLFMIEKGLSKGFVKVGPSPLSLYKGDFAKYAKSKIGPNYCDEELNDYFLSTKNQNLINDMFLANVIRSRFGRVMELYILLDRALYFKELGM
ncbi:MAG: SAM-dependent methyltransferase, partial [Bdellovibrionales bacterium]|nr:SAM-dependent methyltransferase [Bdellovibrionales bacterium]